MRRAAATFFTLLLVVTGLGAADFDAGTLWRRALGGEIDAYPAQGPDGSVYIVADDRALHSIDPMTGEARWIYRPGGRLRNLLMVASDGTIYIQNDRQELFAVTPGGTGRWKLKMNTEPAALPAATPEGRLILPLVGGRLVSVSRHGVIVWKKDQSAEASAAPVVDAAGRVWIPLTDGSIVGLDPWGEEERRFSFAGPASILAMDVVGRLWAGGFGGKVAVFDLSRDENSPRFTIRPSVSRVAAIITEADGRGRIYHADGTAVVIGPQGEQTSRIRMAVSGGFPSLAADGTLYLPASDGAIHVFAPGGGKTVLKGGSALAEPLLTEEGILIAGSRDWILYAWNAGPAGGGWRQFRGGPRRSGTLPAEVRFFDRAEARKDAGFFYREQMALSDDVSQRLALIRELESFPDEGTMYRELPWVGLLLEDLAAVGTIRHVAVPDQPLQSHAVVRRRAYLLLGSREDHRVRDLVLRSLKHEEDALALGAGFEALGRLGADWDGASMRLMAARYRSFTPVDNRLTLAAVRALVDLVRYNGGLSDPAGYGLMDDLLRNAAGRTREEVVSAIRSVSGL